MIKITAVSEGEKLEMAHLITLLKHEQLHFTSTSAAIVIDKEYKQYTFYGVQDREIHNNTGKGRYFSQTNRFLNSVFYTFSIKTQFCFYMLNRGVIKLQFDVKLYVFLTCSYN